jgi:hypothetical protein
MGLRDLGIEGFRDSGMGLRDLGIEGFRDSGIERL